MGLAMTTSKELLDQNQKLIKNIRCCDPESNTILHLQKMADYITLLESELDSAIESVDYYYFLWASSNE